MDPAKRDDVARLSERLREALLQDQREEKAPPGLVKCPACGAAIAPTKNGQIRVHESDPYEKVRCEASGKKWVEGS